ncbi:hypothetical protein HJC23_009208 [Cyclotella cryptica]|uniref:Fucolectin tachylectin-4 pentraxin-1 domain-containing protein n=1 Tax=Cyclotella cryptica TaxID=29204 RepID=A0ABD3P1X3_9STRA
MPVARSSVPTHSSRNKPSLLRTFVIAVLYSPLASASVAAALNLLYVGIGYCQDASGNFYDYVYRYPVTDSSGNRLTGTALLDECSSWCGQHPSQLVGIVTLEVSGSLCYCMFSNPLPTGLTTASYSPAGAYSYNGYNGVGAVKSSYSCDGSTFIKCYSVQVRLCVFFIHHLTLSRKTQTHIPLLSHLQQTLQENPSTSPSASPTSSPSRSPSFSPSHSPTSPPRSPSSSPSRSPTSSPTAPSANSTSPCFPQASLVKLQSLTGSPIQVFEVQAYSLGTNVAAGKVATQSSVYNGNSRFLAGNAVDGNENTFSHTAAIDKASWWEVDLGGMFPIESVKIVNRWCKSSSDPADCLGRLSHSALVLFDNEGKWVGTTLLGVMSGVLEFEHDFTSSAKYCTGA